MNELKTMPDDSYVHSWFHPHNIGKSESRKKDLQLFLDQVATEVSRGRLASQNMSSMSNVIANYHGEN
jgi:hypothetical protein